MDITELTVHELQDKLKNKEITISEITKAYSDRIKEKQRTPQNHNRPNVEAGVYKRNRKCDLFLFHLQFYM